MSTSPLENSIISLLVQALGDEKINDEQQILQEYGSDHTEDFYFPPQVIVKPSSTDEVVKVMKIAYEHAIPVTPIAALTGLSGGALAVKGGIGLSLENMNSILKIDEANMQVHVEPAVITQDLQEAVQAKGLYYAPDPASRGSCTIGGNLAENSGGPRAVKYGVTKDFVLNLEIVLPNGNVIWTGANTLKNSTGYNLTQLMIGSEGTLGIITKAVLKLLPYPTQNVLLLAPFKDATKACEAVAAIFQSGITPSALEFMERDAIDWTMNFVDNPPNINLKEEHQAHLLIEVDGNDVEPLYKDCETITNVLEKYECDEVLLADSQAQKEALWFLRRRVGEAVKANSVYKEEDTVVPRYELPKLLKGVKAIGEKFGFKSVCYGHAGDGNLHINIIKGDMNDHDWNNKLTLGIREIFQLTVRLGGTISGEHGIGYVQKQYMDIPFSQIELNLMKGIKKLFDPKGIMNPGKIFMDE